MEKKISGEHVIPPLSWSGKKVKIKESSQDILWSIFNTFPYFNCSFDDGTNIKLTEFREAKFTKDHFELYQ